MSNLEFPLGLNTNNEVVYCDLQIAPHLLIAGATGAGKSVGLHSMICALLSKNTPDDLMFMMIDTKMVELSSYEDIPHLLCPIVDEAYDAVDKLRALVGVMEKRYSLAKSLSARTLDEINEKLAESEELPYIVVVCDEIADLIMTSRREVEESIVRIAQKARAVGIHLVLATQSPRREIITGILKCNLPSRLCFSTSSELDSRIVLDQNGAGNLSGSGDALYSEQGKTPTRIQGAYVSSEEISSLVNFWSMQSKEVL
jgi:DNA segregation ATPase FtsK/SpoIIIE, S-DNA-T family